MNCSVAYLPLLQEQVKTCLHHADNNNTTEFSALLKTSQKCSTIFEGSEGEMNPHMTRKR